LPYKFIKSVVKTAIITEAFFLFIYVLKRDFFCDWTCKQVLSLGCELECFWGKGDSLQALAIFTQQRKVYTFICPNEILWTNYPTYRLHFEYFYSITSTCCYYHQPRRFVALELVGTNSQSIKKRLLVVLTDPFESPVLENDKNRIPEHTIMLAMIA
jgi:hypothetical protein